jgi:hypothetical protein
MAMVTLPFGVEQQEGWGRVPSSSVLENIASYVQSKFDQEQKHSSVSQSDTDNSKEQQSSLVNPLERWKR